MGSASDNNLRGVKAWVQPDPTAMRDSDVTTALAEAQQAAQCQGDQCEG